MTRPKVVMIACMSIDGFIARWSGDVPNQAAYGGWTSPEDKEIFKMELSRSDIVLMGRLTFEATPKFGRPTAVMTSKRKIKSAKQPDFLISPNQREMTDWLGSLQHCATVLLCGGAATYTTMLAWDLVDEIALIVEPLMFLHGVPMTDGSGSAEHRYRLLSASRLNQDGTLYLRYGRQ